MLWVAIDDNKNEDQWQDYYTHNVLNHTEAWLPWAPNMGNVENCAVLIKTTSGLTGLDDTHCDFPMSCMCERRPQSFLKLRGLCNDSIIDFFYQPMNNLTDIRQLKLIGLHTCIEHD